MSEQSQNNETKFQQTLKSPINCTGIGLHSGSKVSMTLKPADVNTGIVFVRTDQPADRAEIRADWDRVTDTKLCTVISNDAGVSIGTVEHLMAALRGCGIDNAVIELNGPEVPIMDGSSAPFVFLIECAGIREQEKPRRLICILKQVTVGDSTRFASLTPSPAMSFSFEIDFASAAVARQESYIKLGNGAFKGELARARTFGFLHEVDQLRKLGLASGGSLDNAIVINGDKVLNEGGLRFADEFVRHKILDAIGDTSLFGRPVIGHLKVFKTGHALNQKLVQKVLSDPANYAVVHACKRDVEHMDLRLPDLAGILQPLVG